ncbi:MAG TPA: aminomethyl-transferring glycine dehydrogenase subunit GcvPB [Firmicutes bacterium]|nr:aminomethyl-transferring glycine dehydrogenase subunit GcvPB [Bacillota bacterium]
MAQNKARGPEPLISELSSPGRKGYSLPPMDVEAGRLEDLIPEAYLRKAPPGLPEVSEVDVVRHFIRLSQKNYGVDVGFYPLGSCTMKYNPKVNEYLASLPGFMSLHPYEPEDLVQGALELMYELQQYLCEIGGMDSVSLQPAAGAHGELTGLLMIRAYHEYRGEGQKRTRVIVPDSAHGTNPASAAFCGYKVVEVKSDDRGGVDVRALREIMDDSVAALMLTNPNTLGLFDENIVEVAEIVHEKGGLLYYDGANMNAIMGMARPGDMGFDVLHFNLHKTFSTPHGGGGPGSGPVGVKKALEPFLPVPVVARRDARAGDVQTGNEQAGNGRVEDSRGEGAPRYFLDYDRPLSIGRVRSFYGNFGVMVKAYAYIRALGAKGLKEASEAAVIAANYVLSRLKSHYHVPYDRHCKHEFVISAKNQMEYGVRTSDIAKALLDYGFHAPTIYFPLIVKEAIMVEPTETESKETLDAFCEALIEIADKARSDPEYLHQAPHTTVVGRLDEVTAARKPKLRW